MQNVTKNLFGRKVLKFQGETIYDCTNCHLIETYRDVYLHTKDRENSTFQGISSESMRQLQSGDTVPIVGSDEELLFTVYGNKFGYKLTHPMISNHGCIYPFILPANIEWELTLNYAKYLIKGPTAMDYTITNIKLEYETII